MYPSFPFRLVRYGRVATVGYTQHVQEMIEEVLFTRPGERVNRPDFGCGLEELIFEPAGSEMTAALRLTVQSELQHWLGDLMTINDVDVEADDGTVTVTVVYTLINSAVPETAQFVR